jgi:hypothetical protein
VKPKRRKQAYDRFWRVFTNQGQVVIFRRRVVRVRVEPPADTAKLSGAREEIGVTPWNSVLFQVAWAKDALHPGESQGFVCL